MQLSIQKAPLGKWSLTLISVVAAVAIWLLMGAVSMPAFSGATSWSESSVCENQTDVLRAADRSRNGISLSCNAEMLESARVQK